MKKSIGLLSALVVTTTFIVNCQKAPEKRRVRPSGGSGTAQTEVEKAKQPTKACSADLISNYESYKMNYSKVTEIPFKDMTEVQKNEIKPFVVRAADNCVVMMKGLTQAGETENFSCLNQNKEKNQLGVISQESIKKGCYYVGNFLKELSDKQENELTLLQKDEAKTLADAEKVVAELIGKPLRMSKDAITMVMDKNTNGGKFIIDGVIGSAQTSMDEALAVSKTVCGFVGQGLDVEDSKVTDLEIISAETAVKSDLENLKSDFTGKATLLSTTIKQEGETSPEAINLLCLNLDKNKLSVEKITTVFGQEIVSGPAKIATEMTDGAAAATEEKKTEPAKSADLAAAQPAGSTQEKLLDAATPGLQAQVAADKKAQEEQAAAEKASAEKAAAEKASAEAAAKAQATASATVTVATAQSGAASATADVKAEDVKPTLEQLKEKADALELEAKSKEEELAKLDPAKENATTIDDAKRVARAAREGADAAKAAYEEALKASQVAAK